MTSEIPQSAMMSTQMPHPGMMPPNSYMGYQNMTMMPSTSNGIMCNFSMDDQNMRNSGSPMMQQAQNSPIINGPGPSNFMQGPGGHPSQFPSSMPSFHSQNPSLYSSNGQLQQQQFQNQGMPPQQYFSNQQQQQQIPTTASPSRLNTPNYPPSNASNANNNNNNNTPTYPNHNGTPTYPNPSNMQQPNNPSTFSNNGSQIQNFPPQMTSDFMQNQDERNSSTNPEQIPQQNYQNGEENGYNNFGYMNGFPGPTGPMPPPPFQRQMSTTSATASNMMAAPPLNKTNSNKTMLFNSEMLMDMINSGNLQTAENWHANNSPQNTTGSTKSQRKRKMETSEDKQKKMAKLELIANDLNLTPGDFSQPLVRPMGMPQGPPHPSMMMQMSGQMRPPFPPGYDPHNMQGGSRPPMMLPPGHPMSMHPGMLPPNFPQNGMMPQYAGMASPKFPMMSQQPPMMSPQQGNMPYPMPPMDSRGIRQPQQMNEFLWRQHQQHHHFMQMQQQQQNQNGQMPL
uniref:Uncharacterized protein n=1 Tax=Panagrolaimus sp. PS1159 TaxID=55785 RepID=A0AC35GCB3_9BILA